MDEDLKKQLKTLNQKVIDGVELNPAQQDLHKQLLALAQQSSGRASITLFPCVCLMLLFLFA